MSTVNILQNLYGQLKPAKMKSYMTWCCKPLIGYSIEKYIGFHLEQMFTTVEKPWIVIGADNKPYIVSTATLKEFFCTPSKGELPDRKLNSAVCDWFQVCTKSNTRPFAAVQIPRTQQIKVDEVHLVVNMDKADHGKGDFIVYPCDKRGKPIPDAVKVFTPNSFLRGFCKRGFERGFTTDVKDIQAIPKPSTAITMDLAYTQLMERYRNIEGHDKYYYNDMGVSLEIAKESPELLTDLTNTMYRLCDWTLGGYIQVSVIVMAAAMNEFDRAMRAENDNIQWKKSFLLTSSLVEMQNGDPTLQLVMKYTLAMHGKTLQWVNRLSTDKKQFVDTWEFTLTENGKTETVGLQQRTNTPKVKEWGLTPISAQILKSRFDVCHTDKEQREAFVGITNAIVEDAKHALQGRAMTLFEDKYDPRIKVTEWRKAIYEKKCKFPRMGYPIPVAQRNNEYPCIVNYDDVPPCVIGKSVVPPCQRGLRCATEKDRPIDSGQKVKGSK